MPNKSLQPGQTYKGRRSTAAVLSTTLDREAMDLIRSYAPGKKVGAFVARLVYQHHAAQLEKTRLMAKLQQDE